MTEANLLYALHGDQLLHISQVAAGLSCNCVCPQCLSSLVARKGKVRQHHFAHFSSVPCQYYVETSLHLTAKAILSSKRIITSSSGCHAIQFLSIWI
ncbi:hypothetical protein VU05_03540 [Desulfobulbus sp. F1]|nr:hypothetical protein [Desulfobulbus sp. F1]